MPVKEDIHLSLEQQEAVDLCLQLSERFVSVTGGAGTGKTTILRMAYEQMQERARGIVLCAPTGRAAKRITEATGLPAKTIHKMLEFPMPSDDENVRVRGVDMEPNQPKRNKHNPLDERAIFIDESSMIGPSLMNQIIAACRQDAVVRFFGDTNQLPPIEEVSGRSSPFRQMLQDETSITLTYNFRSDDALIANALRILHGSVPIRNERFEIIYTDDPVMTAINMVDKEFAGPNSQVITPLRRGKYGSMRTNPSLQVRFNKAKDYVLLDRLDEKEPQLAVRKGDKFIWVKNDYTLHMFNGEIGYVEDIDTESGEIWLGIEDRPTLLVPPRAIGRGAYGKFTYDPRKQIELGYAITTHKSQGSEFDEVVYYMTGAQPFLLNRNNLYTGITRAKKRVVLITDRKGMGASLRKSA